LHQPVNRPLMFLRGAGKDGSEAADRLHDDGQRELQHHRAQGATKDDHGSSGLQDLAEVSPFEQQAREDSADRENDPAKAGLVHAYLSGAGPPDPEDLAINACIEDGSQDRESPCRTERRKSMMRLRTSPAFSRTTIFSPVIRVTSVSGACSMNLIRSEFTVRGLLFSRVS
jgi:hypothetical protein